MQKGLTLPNRQWDRYTDSEIEALHDLKPDVVVWLLYGGQIDATHSVQLSGYINAYRPRILYRPFRDDIPMWKPIDWADECRRRIQGLPPGELICMNEQNLAVEKGSTDWPAHIVWLTAFAHAWRRFQPHTPLHLPALSPWGNWVSGLLAYSAAGLDRLFDRVDAHGYGENAPSQIEQVESVLDGPIDVTEFNQIDPVQMTDLGPRVESATWFILGGTEDQSQYDLLRQPATYASFKAASTSPRLPPKNGGHPMPPIPAKFNVGQGVLDLMARHADAPKSDEHYVLDATGQTFKSETFGSKGVYQWNKQANETVLLPFD